MIYFTAHTFQCVCHCIRTMFRVLGVYNFGLELDQDQEMCLFCHSKLLDNTCNGEFFKASNVKMKVV